MEKRSAGGDMKGREGRRQKERGTLHRYVMVLQGAVSGPNSYPGQVNCTKSRTPVTCFLTLLLHCYINTYYNAVISAVFSQALSLR